MDAVAAPAPSTWHYAVGGMTCSACARQVEDALQDVPGVRSARVDFASGEAVIEAEERPPSFEILRSAVVVAGYQLEPPVGSPTSTRMSLRSIAFGTLAAGAVLSFYLGLITIAQGWTHAVQQLAADRWFVGAIAAGFGAQVGLFAYLRSSRGRATAGGVAASAGTSTTAMLACCAPPDRHPAGARIIGCGGVSECLQDAAAVAGHCHERGGYCLHAVADPPSTRHLCVLTPSRIEGPARSAEPQPSAAACH
jgi:cation transport ATPase